ncbi:hypothetical protein [Acetobacter papayae]|uniref:hypothetical protein n=1 Tax=Acetobacter papayae TaxID=1076592 RepID=UPI0004700154|nr:hypothetical protein [Acetobacter papayae]
MKQVRACRVGAFVAASLMGVSAPVRVLAVFPRHVYLVVSLREEDRVVILCPLSEQDGPLCIMLDHWPVWSELAGQEGFFDNGHIRIVRTIFRLVMRLCGHRLLPHYLIAQSVCGKN